MDNKRTYSTKEVAKRLHVEPVTVRKYAQLFEAKGYVYKKDSKGWRQFTDGDISAFEYYLTFRYNNNFTVEDSIDHVASLYRENFSVLPTDTTLQGEDSPLLAFMKKQEEFNQELMQEVQKQREYIDTRLEQRDQQLTTVLRQLSASKQQKKKWWEFWK